MIRVEKRADPRTHHMPPVHPGENKWDHECGLFSITRTVGVLDQSATSALL